MNFFLTTLISLVFITLNAEVHKEYIVTGSDVTESETFELENKSK